MPDAYKNARRAPTDLGSGRVLAPGEAVLASDLDLSEGGHDRALLDSGTLIESAAPAEPALSGDALQEHARRLKIPNRSTMSADELRAAVAEAQASRASHDQEGKQ